MCAVSHIWLFTQSFPKSGNDGGGGHTLAQCCGRVQSGVAGPVDGGCECRRHRVHDVEGYNSTQRCVPVQAQRRRPCHRYAHGWAAPSVQRCCSSPPCCRPHRHRLAARPLSPSSHGCGQLTAFGRQICSSWQRQGYGNSRGCSSAMYDRATLPGLVHTSHNNVCAEHGQRGTLSRASMAGPRLNHCAQIPTGRVATRRAVRRTSARTQPDECHVLCSATGGFEVLTLSAGARGNCVESSRAVNCLTCAHSGSRGTGFELA